MGLSTKQGNENPIEILWWSMGTYLKYESYISHEIFLISITYFIWDIFLLFWFYFDFIWYKLDYITFSLQEVFLSSIINSSTMTMSVWPTWEGSKHSVVCENICSKFLGGENIKGMNFHEQFLQDKCCLHIWCQLY